jgi:hypothetical protein
MLEDTRQSKAPVAVGNRAPIIYQLKVAVALGNEDTNNTQVRAAAAVAVAVIVCHKLPILQ